MVKQFAVEPTLVEGSGGIFDVSVDGETIYSKHQTGEFPDEGKLIDSIRP